MLAFRLCFVSKVWHQLGMSDSEQQENGQLIHIEMITIKLIINNSGRYVCICICMCVCVCVCVCMCVCVGALIQFYWLFLCLLSWGLFSINVIVCSMVMQLASSISIDWIDDHKAWNARLRCDVNGNADANCRTTVVIATTISRLKESTTPPPPPPLLPSHPPLPDPQPKNLQHYRVVTDKNGGNDDGLASSRWWLRVVVRANRRSIQPLAV